MIVVIDYDTGNTRNVKKALDYLGVDSVLSADPAQILSADGLILPGVGAFKKAMLSLKERGLVTVIQKPPVPKFRFSAFAWGCRFYLKKVTSLAKLTA